MDTHTHTGLGQGSAGQSPSGSFFRGVQLVLPEALVILYLRRWRWRYIYVECNGSQEWRRCLRTLPYINQKPPPTGLRHFCWSTCWFLLSLYMLQFNCFFSCSCSAFKEHAPRMTKPYYYIRMHRTKHSEHGDKNAHPLTLRLESFFGD